MGGSGPKFGLQDPACDQADPGFNVDADAPSARIIALDKPHQTPQFQRPWPDISLLASPCAR